jgi:hypothetical protein
MAAVAPIALCARLPDMAPVADPPDYQRPGRSEGVRNQMKQMKMALKIHQLLLLCKYI